MTDKELIKQEIERRINLLQNGDADPEVMKRVEGVLLAYNSILQFIDSIPEESASEDLENTILNLNNTKMYANRKAGIKSFAETYSFNIESVLFNQLTLEQQELWRKEIENAVINGGEIGLELSDDKRYDERESSKDLDLLVISLEETIGTSPHSREVIKEHLQKAAEWQKAQDQETIELAEDHAMLAGMEKMREEMMKDAVEGTVKYEIGSAEIPQCDKHYQVLSDQVHIPNVKLGDKVKIIIVKEEQQ